MAIKNGLLAYMKNENTQMQITTILDDANLPRVVAIVPVFNRLKYTIECLKMLKAQTYPGLEIIVVDGGSTDSTPVVVRQTFPDVKIINNCGDLWWTDAVALAIEKELPLLTSKDYIFLINNDTILNDDTIYKLVSTSVEHNNAVVAATVVELSGRGIVSGSIMKWGITLGEPIGHIKECTDVGKVIYVDTVFGRATIIPAYVFHRIGNFDAKNFPQYYGDSDFFLRASQAGISVIIDRMTVVYCHEDESNTGIHFVGEQKVDIRRAWQMATSIKSNLNLVVAWRFIWKHAPGWQKPLSASALLIQNIVTILNLYLRNYPKIHFLICAFINYMNRITRMRPLYLNFSELRRHGFNPGELRLRGAILPSGIPHTYNLNIPRSAMFADFKRYMPLIVRNYNPCVKLRIRRFIEAWRNTKRGMMIISQ